MPEKELVHTLRVSSCEVDSFGHVNNAVYLQYCERARNDYMLQVGLKFTDFKEWNAGPVLHRAQLTYSLPAVVDDELEIGGILEATGRTRFRIQHRFVRASDQEWICTADLEFAFVDLDRGRPCRVPVPFLEAFGVAQPSCIRP